MALEVEVNGDTATVSCTVDLSPYSAEIAGSGNANRTRAERIVQCVSVECDEYRTWSWKLLADLEAEKAAAQAVVDAIQAKIDAL